MAFLYNKAKEARKNLHSKAAQTHANIHIPTLADATGKFGLGTIVDGVNNVLGFSNPALKHPHESSAPITQGNNVKFHVAGCAYFWAVSEAIENAKDSIWIQGWWVSPEVYLRRPPLANEKYRLDRMLTAAAERGVQVRIIVYKEMPETIHLESKHTKHWLENCHKNIQVFRHPDWYASPKEAASSLNTLAEGAMKGHVGVNDLKNLGDDQIEKAIALASLPIPGWTHHEKLCIVDYAVALMGGIDLCYGRWDTIQHPIADIHPQNIDRIVYPGQDYNNGRVKDFANLANPDVNHLDRQMNSRMGWEDIGLSVTGPVISDLCAHFEHRWNFLYDKKYNTVIDTRYTRCINPWFVLGEPSPGHVNTQLTSPTIANPDFQTARPKSTGGVSCQLLRSASRWSDGTPTERSIYNAYIETIEKSEHYIYIENQFFITKSSLFPLTVWNRIGEALANRVIKAAKAGTRYKVFVVMPSVMTFPGELSDPRAFPARLTMKHNYHSINQGLFFPNLYSTIKRAGYDPANYVHFYNLRTYDRINAGSALRRREEVIGTSYAKAGADVDDIVDSFGTAHAAFEGAEPTLDHEAYSKYRAATKGEADGAWDTVSSCYMKDGADIRSVPWNGDPDQELEAFVSEQLYVHSKVMIADDKVVICGSANLNDRSMKGTRDSEIALYIEDSETVVSKMGGKPYEARKFAATMRRYIFRKHLGLLSAMDMQKPDGNFHPAPTLNGYDFDSEADKLVIDPLGDDFLALWQGTAKTNTEAFWKVFAPAPDNSMKTWAQYVAKAVERKLGSKDEMMDVHLRGWGHVMRPNFPAGREGARQVKEILATIKGTLVDMPLQFMEFDDIELLMWNPLTQIVAA